MAGRLEQRVARIIDAKASARRSTLAKLVAAVWRLFDGADLADDRSVGVASRGAAQLVRAAQRKHGGVSAAAARKVLAEYGVEPPPEKPPSIDSLVREDDVQKIVATVTLRTKEEPAEAPRQLRAELEKLSDEALSAADREAQADTYEKNAVNEKRTVGYRRVVHPELSKGGACGLCVAASMNVYSRPDLKPIHDRCHCEVVPIIGGQDIGDLLNRYDLGQLYSASGSTDGASLKRVRVDSSGAIIAKASRKNKKRSKKAEQLDESKRNVMDDPKWIRHQIALTEPLKPSDWRTKQLKRLRARLAELEAAA